MNDEIDLADERQRLDAEWIALNTLREALSVGLRSSGGKDLPYLDTLDFGRQVAPRLFDPMHSLLSQAQEPRLVSEYRRRADAESILQQRTVLPAELLDREILQLERMADVGPARELNSALARLRSARNWFDSGSYSEHKVISRDVLSAKRPDLPLPPMAFTDYVDYPLPFEQALRIRVLHPDKPEHATGADLLYEFCDQSERRARLAFVQYKMWDGRSLRFSDAKNLSDQLQRMHNVACAAGVCTSHTDVNVPDRYRLPFCAAFLRPTDRLQSADATMISSGIHVPVCVALSTPIHETGGRILRKDPVRPRSISQSAFEELFARGMIGSHWLPYEGVEELYRSNEIFDSKQRIVVHAQEYSLRGRGAA